ncbi:MAG: rhodanese-like domain-containing protein [Mycobacterium sp.]|uniref:rhodanese-like domain-containing protein n=1 Tax=Mycobacterium sp. TaxID=1785 RepID=UPI003F9B76F6
MAKSVTQLVQAANAVVPRIAAAQAQELIAEGGALVVDVREASEVQQSGKVSGAVHVPRGLLEFVADPQSPSHDPRFETGKPVIVYCAGGRTRGSRRAGAQGNGLRRGLQPGRVRRLGGQRRGDRHRTGLTAGS